MAVKMHRHFAATRKASNKKAASTSGLSICLHMINMVAPAGLEPATRGL